MERGKRGGNRGGPRDGRGSKDGGKGLYRGPQDGKQRKGPQDRCASLQSVIEEELGEPIILSKDVGRYQQLKSIIAEIYDSLNTYAKNKIKKHYEKPTV